MKPRSKPMDDAEIQALRRVIDYAKTEATQQKQSFTAYLLDLALNSLESPQLDQRPS